MKLKKITSIVFSVLVALVINNLCCCFADENEDAERLYTEMKQFISEHLDVDPEHFYDVSEEFINGRIPDANLLSSSDFWERAKDETVLYRGVSDKNYIDHFKRGHILTRGRLLGARGTGIYTTPNLETAKYFSLSEDPENIITMSIDKDKTKILEYDYLLRLRDIIAKKHADDFGSFDEAVQADFHYHWCIAFGKISDYVNEKVAELGRDASMEEKNEFTREAEEKLKKEDPNFLELLEKNEYYSRSPEAYIWRNHGVLTRLLGYDVLHTYDNFSPGGLDAIDEYLVVNPNAIHVLAE